MQKPRLALIVWISLMWPVALAQTGPSDAKELESFLDGAMSVAMETNHVPGGVVAIVKDGKILLAKGYGYADLDRKHKVDPEKTLFRIGSVTKLFTWTAAMQLVEQGKLELDADINTYLKDFKIPQTYPQPITLLNLMAHNAGFEDRVIGLFARTPDKMVPLGQLLANDLPARVRPPGQLSGYSNHGVGLAGHIIAQLSGRPVEDYFEQNIFTPLGMTRTTLRQPVPQELQANLAKGYDFKDGRFVENPFTFVPLAPAGGISTTATDMARFMIAHLQLGQYGQGRILQQATAEEMHRTHFRHDPHVGGWAHGFAEGFHGNLRAIGHGGGTNDFFTEFTLVPEKNLGLFASFNGTGGLKAQLQMVKAFWDRYFPLEFKPGAPSPGSAERATQVAGSYGTTRSCSTTFCKAAGVFSSIAVQADSAGGITAQLPYFGLRRYAEVEPWVFRQQDGDDLLVFHRGDSGQVDVLFRKNSVDEAHPRLPWYLTNAFSLGLMVTTVLVFLSAVLGWPVLRFFGRRSKTRPAAWARWLAGITAVVFLASMVTMGLGLSDLNEVTFAIPPLVRISLNLALAAAIGSIAVVVAAVLAWRGNYWTLWGRLHYSLVALAALAMVWFMSYWKLLGLG